jgi:hypothetical protein
MFGFNFNQHANDKVGVLRTFVKKQLKLDKKESNGGSSQTSKNKTMILLKPTISKNKVE